MVTQIPVARILVMLIQQFLLQRPAHAAVVYCGADGTANKQNPSISLRRKHCNRSGSRYKVLGAYAAVLSEQRDMSQACQNAQYGSASACSRARAVLGADDRSGPAVQRDSSDNTAKDENKPRCRKLRGGAKQEGWF